MPDRKAAAHLAIGEVDDEQRIVALAHHEGAAPAGLDQQAVVAVGAGQLDARHDGVGDGIDLGELAARLHVRVDVTRGGVEL